MIDISAIVTVHKETLLAGPSMRSAERAIKEAEAAGFVVEKLVGFDSPSDDAIEYFSQPHFSTWGKHYFEWRDQGRVRNDLAKLASGRWIAFLDADDLWSGNWLVEAANRLSEAEQSNQKVIVHPEFNWFFDRHGGLLEKIGQDDPLFTPYYFYFKNYYDALCMAPAMAHTEVLYADRDLDRGYGYEDWQWSIETMAAGWCHITAPNTIIFKRRREESQTIKASARSVTIRKLEAMSIENISKLGSVADRG